MTDWLGNVAQLIFGLLLIGGVFFLVACVLPTAIVIDNKKASQRGLRSRSPLVNLVRSYADRLVSRHWKVAALLYTVIFTTVAGCVVIAAMFGTGSGLR